MISEDMTPEKLKLMKRAYVLLAISSGYLKALGKDKPAEEAYKLSVEIFDHLEKTK